MAVIDVRHRRRRPVSRRKANASTGLVFALAFVAAYAVSNTQEGARWAQRASDWLASAGVSSPMPSQAPAEDVAATDFDAPASHGALAGRPSRITDGDTFRLGGERIRLSGIDAPEMKTPSGPIARAELGRLIGRGEVRCEDTGERSYDRIVAVCYGPDGQDLAAAMVRSGWARDWPRYSHGRYAGMQREAERAGRGMHDQT